MRAYNCKFVLTAAISALAILFLCPTLQATSVIMLTGDYGWSYEGAIVGPYLATLDGTQNVNIFCLDLHVDTPVQTPFGGTLSHPSTEGEEESAFLAAYSLTVGAPNGSLVNSVEGPISMAIWQLMGTMGTTPADPAAAPFILMAQNAYHHGLISTAFLSSINIWSPAIPGSEQRFMTAATPEPDTLVLLGTGMLLLALSRIRRRRR